MTDNLPKVEADTIELIGGGAVFALCAGYLIWALGYRLPPQLTGDDVARLSTPLALLGVTLAYVLGVWIESLSRVLFEWDLNRMTVRHDAFNADETPKSGGSMVGQNNERQEPCNTVEAHTPTKNKDDATKEPSSIRYAYLGRDGDKRRYNKRDLGNAIDERERKRLAIAEELSTTAVDSQLKRLRLERMLCLSASVLTIALAINGIGYAGIGWMLMGLASTIITFGLVHVRFQRYCETVARMYDQYIDMRDSGRHVMIVDSRDA